MKGSVPNYAQLVDFDQNLATQLFDLVIANILYVVLARIIDDLSASLKPNGLLVLSGVLIEDEADMVERALPTGLVLNNVLHEDGWSCMRFVKNK